MIVGELVQPTEVKKKRTIGAPIEDKFCKECSKQLVKKRYESRARFAKKQFCSLKCSRKYMKEHRLGWWREGDFEPKSEPPKGDNRLVKNAMENWEFDTEANIRLSVEDKQILAELDSLGFE